MKIEFTERFDIPSATAQQRGHGAHGKTWESPGLKAARAAWQALFEKHRPKKPLEGAVEVCAILCYHAAVGRFTPKTTRPDLDNLAKVIGDALMAAGIVAEDSTIYHWDIYKFNIPTEENVTFRIFSNKRGE